VDEISQLLDQAVYKPVVGRFKVYMIDEVHMLTNHAFNAMLKTLEEPAEYLKFVLATTDPQKVPPTVLSRCLQFNLRPMAPETVLEHLQQVLQAEQIAAEPGALRLLARAARGSMRDALSLTDQAIAFGSGVLSEAGVRQMLGAVDRGHVLRLINALAAGDGPALLSTVDEMRQHGLSAAAALEEMATILQEIAVLQVVPEAGSADTPEADELQALASALPAEDTQLLYSIALHGRNELGLAPDEYGGLTMALLRMLAFRPLAPGGPQQPAAPLPSCQTATSRVTQQGQTRPPAPARPAPSQAAARPAPAAARSPVGPADAPPWDSNDVPPAPPASEGVRPPPVASGQEPKALAAPTLHTTPLGDRWQALTTQMIERELVTALVRELAMQSQCLGVDESTQPPRWQLRVERETLASSSVQARLQAALAEVLGHPVTLEVQVGVTDDTPARRDAAAKARRQQAAEAAILNDPYVQSLMNEFSTARIVPGSIKPL
jgi:DNA polymerase-3 subunit gamma/tau